MAEEAELPVDLNRRIEAHAPKIAAQLLQLLPELQSVAIVFEWPHPLDLGVPAGLWVDRKGVVGARDRLPPADSAAPAQTLRLLRAQAVLLERSLERLSRTLRERTELLQQVTEALDDRKTRLEATTREEFPGPGGGGGDASGPAAAAANPE